MSQQTTLRTPGNRALAVTHIANDGTVCPYCSASAKISSLSRQRGKMTVTIGTCTTCDSAWENLYAMRDGELVMIGYDPSPSTTEESINA